MRRWAVEYGAGLCVALGVLATLLGAVASVEAAAGNPQAWAQLGRLLCALWPVLCSLVLATQQRRWMADGRWLAWTVVGRSPLQLCMAGCGPALLGAVLLALLAQEPAWLEGGWVHGDQWVRVDSHGVWHGAPVRRASMVSAWECAGVGVSAVASAVGTTPRWLGPVLTAGVVALLAIGLA